jgi:hypothetical protein
MLLWLCCGFVPVAGASTMIGGFDASRGGLESLANSYSETGLRDAIASAFPGSIFTSSATLTSSYLSTLNLVILGVGAGELAAIQPLSTAEQDALKGFVQSGGSAIIFTDNSSFDVADPLGNQASTANNSLLAPFGLDSTGTLPAAETALVTPGGTFLTTGAGGTASQLDTSNPGWFDVTGNSTVFATYVSNGQAAGAYFGPGALGVGSGAVIFFADSSIMVDGIRTSNDLSLILNAVGFGLASDAPPTPEPASWALIGLGLAAIAAARRTRASTPRSPLPARLQR